MDSIFKICKNGPCGITISGLERDNDEYLDETEDIIISTRNYAYSQCTTINVLISITSDNTETLQDYSIVEHTIDCIDESDMIMPIDGLFQISHIIIPNKLWLDYVLEKDSSALDAYNLIIYYDSGQFYKYTKESVTEITIDEILKVDATPPTDVRETTNTVIRSDKNTFCLCHINDCFYKLCKSLLGSLPGKCYNKVEDIKLNIYNRDIIWMSINVIKYLIELSQYYEAQRILEDILQCGNLCKNVNVISGGYNCGCTN